MHGRVAIWLAPIGNVSCRSFVYIHFVGGLPLRLGWAFGGGVLRGVGVGWGAGRGAGWGGWWLGLAGPGVLARGCLGLGSSGRFGMVGWLVGRPGGPLVGAGRAFAGLRSRIF